MPRPCRTTLSPTPKSPRRIENRGISRASEIKMILEEASKVILEEVMENNRVQLDTGEGVLVSIYGAGGQHQRR